MTTNMRGNSGTGDINNALRLAAEDIHSRSGHNTYSSVMSKSADEIESLRGKLASVQAEIAKHDARIAELI